MVGTELVCFMLIAVCDCVFTLNYNFVVLPLSVLFSDQDGRLIIRPTEGCAHKYACWYGITVVVCG